MREIKVYSEEEHLKKGTATSIDLYKTLKERILAMGEITIVPRQKYIAFKRNTNVCGVKIRKDALKITIYVTEGNLDDPYGIAHLTSFEHWGKYYYEVDITNHSDIVEAMPLFEQAYRQAV